jgi:hypothetical protein
MQTGWASTKLPPIVIEIEIQNILLKITTPTILN